MESKAVFFFMAHVVIPDTTFSTKDHPVIENENVDPETLERNDSQFILTCGDTSMHDLYLLV